MIWLPFDFKNVATCTRYTNNVSKPEWENSDGSGWRRKKKKNNNRWCAVKSHSRIKRVHRRRVYDQTAWTFTTTTAQLMKIKTSLIPSLSHSQSLPTVSVRLLYGKCVFNPFKWYRKIVTIVLKTIKLLPPHIHIICTTHAYTSPR